VVLIGAAHHHRRQEFHPVLVYLLLLFLNLKFLDGKQSVVLHSQVNHLLQVQSFGKVLRAGRGGQQTHGGHDKDQQLSPRDRIFRRISADRRFPVFTGRLHQAGVQHRNQEQGNNHGKHDSYRNHAGQRAPQRRAGKDHGNHTDRRGAGGQKDGAQSPFSGLDRGCCDGRPAAVQFVGMVQQDDGVSDHDAGEADQADKRGKSKRVAGHQQAQHGPEHAERNGQHDHKRFLQVAELEKQHQKNHKQTDDQSRQHFGKGFFLVFVFSPVFDFVTRRQGKARDPRTGHFQHLRGQIAVRRLALHGQRTQPVEMVDPAGLPLWFQGGNLAKRHARAGHGRRQIQVFHVAEMPPTFFIQAKHDVHSHIPFVQRGYGSAGESRIDGFRHAFGGEPQALGAVFEPDGNAVIILPAVQTEKGDGLCPPKNVLNFVPYGLHRREVFADNPDFDGGVRGNPLLQQPGLDPSFRDHFVGPPVQLATQPFGVVIPARIDEDLREIGRWIPLHEIVVKARNTGTDKRRTGHNGRVALNQFLNSADRDLRFLKLGAGGHP